MIDLTKFINFTDDIVYVAFAIARKKTNPTITESGQIVIREPVRSLESIPYKIEKLKGIASQRNLNFYIYISANARSTRKAYKIFRKKLIDYEDEPGLYSHQLARLHKVWYDSLMQTDARATKYFLIDIDTKDSEVLKNVRNIILNWEMKGNTASILFEQETRNGFHWVTTGFDIRIISGIENVEVHKDGLLYLDCVGFEDTEKM